MQCSTWHTYIVLCGDGSYYTGITTDLQRRVAQHNAGVGAKYTRMRGPISLVYSEKYDDRARASQREYEIKQMTREQKSKLMGAECPDKYS